jgi:conjugal transfer pilus assembly protein TraF
MRLKGGGIYIFSLTLSLTVAIFLQPRTARAQPPSSAGVNIKTPSGQNSISDKGSDYCQRQLGTWFYCDKEAESQSQQTEASPSGAASQDEADMAAAQAFKAEMEKARLIAVWNPTDFNIRRYYAFQQVTLGKSGLFADTVRRLIWSDPSLDYTLQRPIGAAAKSAWVETRTTDRDLFFRSVYDQIGLFYIYRANCGPCRAASPIVREFGQRFGVTIKPISVDGSANAEFTDFVTDHGQLKAWGITQSITPAYLIYQKPTLDRRGRVDRQIITVSNGKQIILRACENPKGCLTYLGAGVLSVDELAERLFVTLATEPGADF